MVHEKNELSDSLSFTHLPGYATFLLENKIDDYALEVSKYLNEEEISLIKKNKDAELTDALKKLDQEFLSAVAENKVREYAEISASNYVENCISYREALVAEDITRVSFIRRRVLSKFLPEYTKDFQVYADIMEEVDRFLMVNESLSFRAYIALKQAKLSNVIEQLRQSEALHNQAQAITHIGNWTWEIAANKITWSDEMYRIYGLEPQSEEITFERFVAFIHPEDRDKRVSEIHESLRTLTAQDYLMRIINPDGTKKMLRGKGEVIVDSKNEPLRLLGTCQDITGEYRLNAVLQEKEEYLKQLIRDAPDAVIVADTSSRITFWNFKAEKLFGWSAEEVIGKSLNETIIPLQYREAHSEGMKRLLQTGEARILNKTVELSALNKQGEEFLVSLTISQFLQQQQPQFIAFLRDVSEEKRTKAELQAKTFQLERLNTSLRLKNTELERINKELESFNYVVSHDLQEPLRKIQIFSSRILEKGYDELPPSTMKYLDKIAESSKRMKRLIEDLLTFSQTTTSNDNFQSTDLNNVLGEVKDILAPAIDEKKVIIEAGPLPELPGIPFQLRQLFLNLISNSIKYSRENVRPHIVISSDVVKGEEINTLSPVVRENYYRIKFEDNGIGFDASYVEKVFDLFQRLHHKNEYSGTGIGLAICKKIVHNHNGFITAEGNPGKGAVFNVYFPENLS